MTSKGPASPAVSLCRCLPLCPSGRTSVRESPGDSPGRTGFPDYSDPVLPRACLHRPRPPFSTTPKFLSPLLSLQCTCAFCAFHLSQGGGRGTGAWHPQEWGLWPYFCHILWDEVLIHEMGIIIPPPSWACFLSSDPLFSQHHGFPSPGVGRLWPMVCL